MRWRVVILVALLACERSPASKPAPPPAAPRDARASDAAASDAMDLRTFLDKLPAPYPPPAPVVPRHVKGDCRAEYAPRPDRDPNPMCLVKGGTFMMGQGSGAHPVTLGDYFIDQHEVTVAQAVLFLNAHGNKCPGDLDQYGESATVEIIGAHSCLVPGTDENRQIRIDGVIENNGRFEVKPGYEHIAAENFSYEGAMRYCEWVGKQVQSSAQWEYAGRHDPVTKRDLLYPWGDRWEENRAACASCDRPRLNVAVFDGTHGRGDGESPWGVHDMVWGAIEFAFACPRADESCHPGSTCSCAIEQLGAGDPRLHTEQQLGVRPAPAGPFGTYGVRCTATRSP